MRVHRTTPTRLVLVERDPSSAVLLWTLLAGVPVSASLAWKHQSWVAVAFTLICLASLGILWRWGARRVVRMSREGTIRLRDHKGVRWEYPVDRIEEVEVSGDPEAHGGRDYHVILLVRHAGWVSLNPGAAQSRHVAVTAANAIRTLLGWEGLKEPGSPTAA